MIRRDGDRPRPIARQVRVLGPVLVAGVLLAGCAGIPESGPVVTGRVIGDVPRAPLWISPAGPKDGDTPEQIVRGFLRAAAEVTDDRDVAREFLTGDRRDTWHADESVVVYGRDTDLKTHQGPIVPAPAAAPATRAATPVPPAVPASHAAAPASRAATPAPPAVPAPHAAGPTSHPSPPVTRIGTPVTRAGTPATRAGTPATRAGTPATRAGTPAPRPADGAQVSVQITVPVEARISANGEYRIAAPGDVERRTFGLVARGGQWRITTLADGSVLDHSDFETTYGAFPVYFPDPTGGWLVPDVRWFPVGNAIVTVLVKAVLAGPSPWLAPGVTSGAPAGTRLTADSVPVQQGVAMVDLTEATRQADALHRQMLHVQLEKTLGVLSTMSPIGVDHVAITVESRAFEVSRAHDPGVVEGRRPGEPSLRLLVDPVVDEAPVVIDNGRLMRLSSGQLTPVPGLKGFAGALSWPALATDGTAFAALHGGDRLLYAEKGGTADTLVSGLGPLTPPSFDPLGWVWTVGSAGQAIRAARPDRPVASVATDGWPAGLSVTSLRISRDGTRAAVTGTDGGSGAVFVCAVERDRNGDPVRLGPPQTVLPGMTSARSVAWLDQRRLAVLGARGDGPEQVWKVEVGGNVEAPLPVTGAIGVTAGNGGDIYAATADGVQEWAVSSWIKVSSAHWPAMAG